MKRITADDKRSIAQVLPKPGGDDVLVERDGRPVALIVPLDEEEYWWYSKEKSGAFRKSLAKAHRHAREGKVKRLSEVEKELGIK
jgi:antitoxin (DNA-binding transcriptional repressor) of toxin-antitoxin stability system